MYLVVYRKLDGCAPTALGEGSSPKFSPDGMIAAATVLSSPPKLALHPIGTGESRRLTLGDIVNLTGVAWFPDGKQVLLEGSTEGQPLRSYEMDLEGGKPQPLGPADFKGVTVSGDGKKIAGRNGAGEAVVFDRETQNVRAISGIAPQDQLQKWTKDGTALLVNASTPREAHIYRVEVATGKKTLVQNLEPSEKAGSMMNLRMYYAEDSKTYAYNERRVLSTLYVVEGLQ